MCEARIQDRTKDCAATLPFAIGPWRMYIRCVMTLQMITLQMVRITDSEDNKAADGEAGDGSILQPLNRYVVSFDPNLWHSLYTIPRTLLKQVVLEVILLKAAVGVMFM